MAQPFGACCLVQRGEVEVRDFCFCSGIAAYNHGRQTFQTLTQTYIRSPLAVQRILEQLMTSDTWPVYTPFAKEHFGRGKKEGRIEGRTEGKAEGKTEDILLVLTARNLDVSDTERERITGCTDLKQLKKWITRAVTVEKTSDLFD